MKLWKSTTYRSRYSRKVLGYLHVEASTRAEAKARLAELAAVSALAPRAHAALALSGDVRHTLVVERMHEVYSASYFSPVYYARGAFRQRTYDPATGLTSERTVGSV